MGTIGEKTGQGWSVTEPSRALALFTNRHNAIKHFTSLLNDDISQESVTPAEVLFFHGDGGNGKSLLLSFLQEKCCKRFSTENWEYVKAFEGEEFVAHVSEAAGTKEIPSAFIDFQRRPALGEGSVQDATTALLNIRRELSSYGFRFPLFDFACIWYLHKARDLPGEQIKQFFPAQDLVVGVIDALTKSSVASLVKAVINLKSDKLNTLYTVFKYKRALDKEQLEMIERMNVKRDLLDKLPGFFAADLNAAMRVEGSPERVVLFFDTHEAFWGAKERDLTNDRFFYRDEWLRALLISLELSDGIVAVVAGRERPKWPEAALFPIPEKFLKLWLVGHLSNQDAATYLTRAGISDQSMQRALITYASSEPNEVHPFYLGLCVDIMEAAKRQATPIGVEEFKQTGQLKTKEQQLIERLLRYVDVSIGYAVRALSACRAFNMDIYLRLGREMNFNADAPSFEVLTNFSFVWKPKKEMVGWYRIHNLVRRLGRDNTDALVRRADEVLEAYYRERQLQGDESAIAEAIYHANQLDWERGTTEWVEVFNQAFEKSRYKFCAELLDVRQEMTINSDFDIGRVSQVEGEYFFTLSRYDNALQEYMESIHAYNREISLNPDFAMAHNNKGITLIRLGDLQAETALYQASAETYQEAIATFDIVLGLAPDLMMAHSNKGLALLRLGELQAARSLHQIALKSCREAIVAFDTALALDPGMLMAHNNKGLALLRVGESLAAMSRHQEAIKSYQEAVRACEDALLLAPDLVMAQSNKGGALLRLGESQAEMSRHQEAIKSYQDAIVTFDTALAIAPDYITVHSNRGVALVRTGESLAAMSRHQEAIKSHREAIVSYDKGLALAPDFVMAHNNKGLALLRIGVSQAAMSQHQEAMMSYQEAIAACDKCLSIAPDFVITHNNKGLALGMMGELQIGMLLEEEAMTSYQSAIVAYDKALTLAPDSVMTHTNKGGAIIRLGELKAEMSRYQEAITHFQEALVVFDKALALAPESVLPHNNKGLAQLKLGTMQAMLSVEQEDMSLQQEAIANYARAITAFEKCLSIAPGFVIAHSNNGLTLLSIGELHAVMSRYQEAITSFQQAIINFEKAISLAPDEASLHYNKALTLLKMGEVQAGMSLDDEASNSWEAGLAEVTRGLQLAPHDARAQSLKEAIREMLGNRPDEASDEGGG